MCIQDWQLGRLIRSMPTRLDLPETPAQILTPNSQRVAISFSAIAPLSDAQIMPIVDGAFDQGWPLYYNSTITVGVDVSTVFGYNLLYFSIRDHGDLVTKAWGGSSSGQDPILIVEYILPEGVLYMTPEELRRKAQGK